MNIKGCGTNVRSKYVDKNSMPRETVTIFFDYDIFFKITLRDDDTVSLSC